ncbi:mitogen-activated protein kinase 16, partial [Tanacetum coccineum]
DYIGSRWYRAPELCGIFHKLPTGKPLVPGRSVVRQLDLMTDLIRNEKARYYLTNMRRKRPIPFSDKSQNALSDPYFKNLANVGRSLLRNLLKGWKLSLKEEKLQKKIHLVVNEVDSFDVTPLQAVKLLALNYNTNAPIIYCGVDTPSSTPTPCKSQSSIIHHTLEAVKDNMPDLLSDLLSDLLRRKGVGLSFRS